MLRYMLLLALAIGVHDAAEGFDSYGLNYFWFHARQAGSTSTMDNLVVSDLDSGQIVYANNFESDLNGLQTWFKTDDGQPWVNDSPMIRVENAQLLLETTGFNQNGAGGYNSVAGIVLDPKLPQNFELSYTTRRLQWAGQSDTLFLQTHPTNPPDLTAAGGRIAATVFAGNWGYKISTFYPSVNRGARIEFDARNSTDVKYVKQDATLSYYLNGTLVDTVMLEPLPNTLSWNQLGPGTFSFETAANWTANEIPTANTDVIFPLDGDVDVVPFSTSVANNVIFSDGVVRLKSLGTTTFTSHGSVTVDDPLAANLGDGAFVVLDGTNGNSWTTGVNLLVGNEGFGTFTVNNGADFDAQQVLIGNQSGAEGEVTVAGSGSTMAAALLFQIGNNSGNGILNVLSGGTVASVDSTVGASEASTGAVTVDGAGSTWTNSADLRVGKLGHGELMVERGGAVTVGNDLLVGGDPSNLNDNGVTISNPGSSLMVTERLEVGIEGIGTLRITDGATASSFALTAGDLPGGTGIITLSGPGSSATAVGTSIGTLGAGFLTISAGAQLDSGRFWVGFADDSDSTVDVTGPESTLTVIGVNDLVSMKIGGEPTFDGGTGTMTVSAGGTVISSNDNYIAGNSTSTGTLIVTGPMSLADFNDGGVDDRLAVGYAGEGTLSILDGGRVESEIATIGQRTGASGTVDVGNGNAPANWNIGGSLYVGGSASAAGGTGRLNINSQGTVTVASALEVWDGGEVFLNSPAATLSVGSMALTAGSQFVFQQGNLVLTGSGLDINPAGTLGQSVSLVPGQTLSATGGGLVNDGDLNVIGTTVSFTGGPSVNNAGAEVNAINAMLTFASELTNNGDVNLINSTVNGSLINGGTGTLAMIGSNLFSDDLQLGALDHLIVAISGADLGAFDTLTVGGAADLDGSLNVSFAGGFSPSAGDTFDILTTVGGMAGQFDDESLPALSGDLQWFVNYHPTSLSLVATFAADFHEDGSVDGDDLTDWQVGFGSSDATHIQGDADGDGDTDGADFFVWQRQIGRGAQLAPAQAVPEPSTILLSLLGLSVFAMKHRREGVA